MSEFENQDMRLVVEGTAAVGAGLMSPLVVVEGVLEAMGVKSINLVHCQLLHRNQILNHAARVHHVVKKTSILNFHLLESEFK